MAGLPFGSFAEGRYADHLSEPLPAGQRAKHWYEAMDLLKRHNVQLILCGHGHSNHLLNFEGVPGIMGRSNLRAKDSIGDTICNDSRR